MEPGPQARLVNGQRCGIEVENAHLSTYLYRQTGFDAVKVKAKSTCTTATGNVILTVKIMKRGFIFDHVVWSHSERSNYVPANVSFENKSTLFKCKNTTKTIFYGIASSTATIDGKFYRTGEVKSDKSVQLSCGT